jgi:hypothetical protein
MGLTEQIAAVKAECRKDIFQLILDRPDWLSITHKSETERR